MNEIKYAIVLHVAGIPGYSNLHDTEYDDFREAAKDAGLPVDETDPGESEYAYLGAESGASEEGSFWAKWREGVKDLTASGVLSEHQLREFSERVGAFAEDAETLGTLGGPLSVGVVPDIPFRVESALAIASIRVTPFDPERAKPLSEREWRELRAEVLERFSS